MEAKKSYNLPPGSWRTSLSPNTWEPGGHWCYVLESESLRIRSSDVQKMSWLKKKEEIHPSFILLFHLGPPWMGMMPAYIGEGRSLYSVYSDSNANLFQKHSQDTPRNNVLPAIYPVNLTHKINHHFFKGADSWIPNRITEAERQSNNIFTDER